MMPSTGSARPWQVDGTTTAGNAAKTETAHMSFDPNSLPSMAEIWAWHEELAAAGPRFTGNNAHVWFTDWLRDKFSQIPGFQLKVEKMLFQRWEATAWSLSIQRDPTGPSENVPVSYFFPYSGYTGSG